MSRKEAGAADSRSSGPHGSGSNLEAAFRAVWERYREALASRAGDLGLSGLQVRALHLLEPPRTMGALARLLQAEPSNLTPIVDALEHAGLVERWPVPHDRRVRELRLTDAGHAMRARVESEVFGPLPLFDVLTPADRRELLRLLSVLTDGGPEG